MSLGTTLFIAIFSIANVLACLWLIWWTAKRQPSEVAEGEVNNHVWDGDLQELNNPLPRWWLNMFLLTIVFALVYLALFPGLGGFKGVLGWSQADQHDARLAEVQAKRQAHFAQFEQADIVALADNPEAIRVAGRLFADNCAGCHGPTAQGASGFPSLADDAWLYGDKPEQILASITNGRRGMMPPQQAMLKPEMVDDIVALVADWDNPDLPADRLQAAKSQFMQSCAMCHGAEAQGNIYMGAPNLADDAWLYGSSPEVIRTTILQGRQGNMPAHKDMLSEVERKLLAAYVIWVSGGTQ